MWRTPFGRFDRSKPQDEVGAADDTVVASNPGSADVEIDECPHKQDHRLVW
ncbi:hypothetical protein GCM10027610_055300 [Dactylosporangium cerinum]